ncbi:MAG: hypothetical protein VX399_05950, partial [SAR324 cluster bacterium]|nr:hypothetical protein [SAR324 cluster bacterium]
MSAESKEGANPEVRPGVRRQRTRFCLMGKILNTLETQLKVLLLEGETLKTWPEWYRWLESLGCPLKLKRPVDFPEDRM